VALKFSIRDLFLVTVIVALTAGCKVENGVGGIGGNQKDDDVRYFAPGPEFQRSREEGAARAFAADNPPNYSAPAPNPSKP
jgi:hypothetical protein